MSDDDTLTRLKKAGGEEWEWLLLQMLLKSLKPSQQEAVWAAAIPHWFDLPFLAAVLDKPEVEEFDELITLSFVEQFPGRGYNIHQRSRELLLNKLWQEDQDKFRDLSLRAAEYCEDQDQSETHWRTEAVYHFLVGEPDEGADQFQETGWEWQNPPNFAFEKIELMARLAREHFDKGRLDERGQGWTLYWEAHLDNIYSRFPQAREKLQKIKYDIDLDPYLAADSIRAMGDTHLTMDEYKVALARYEEALPIYQEIEDRLGEANCILAMGDALQMMDEYEAARARYEEALPIFQELEDKLGEANCINALGDVLMNLDEYEAARENFESVLPIFQGTGDRLGEARCIQTLGKVQQMLAEFDGARERYEIALAIYREIGNRLGEANCIIDMGDVYMSLEESETARERYSEALPIYQEIGNRLGEANCIKALGDVEMSLEEYEIARERYYTTLPIYQEIGNKLSEANCLNSLGDVHVNLKEFEKAREMYNAAMKIALDIGARLAEMNALTGLADLDREDENWEAAKQKYLKILDFDQESGNLMNSAISYQMLGHTAKGAGDIAEARSYYQLALDLFAQIGSPAAMDVQDALDDLEA